MPKRSSKQNSDINQLAHSIIEQATNQLISKTKPILNKLTKKKNPAAVALGRLGGLKGGKARAAKLSKDRRKQIAKLAAKARWEDK